MLESLNSLTLCHPSGKGGKRCDDAEDPDFGLVATELAVACCFGRTGLFGLLLSPISFTLCQPSGKGGKCGRDEGGLDLGSEIKKETSWAGVNSENYRLEDPCQTVSLEQNVSGPLMILF